MALRGASSVDIDLTRTGNRERRKARVCVWFCLVLLKVAPSIRGCRSAGFRTQVALLVGSPTPHLGCLRVWVEPTALLRSRTAFRVSILNTLS
eukprot:1184392-Prorocentrum_minimum.AAC.2